MPDNIARHDTEPLDRWHGPGGSFDADPMEREAWQAARVTQDLRAFIASRYPDARHMVLAGALEALAFEHHRGAGVEARGFVDALRRTFAPMPKQWRKHVEAGSVFLRSPLIPARQNLSAVGLVGRPVQCSNGMTFNTQADATAWLRDNGYPSATCSNLSRAVKLGVVAYGLRWSRCEREDVAA